MVQEIFGHFTQVVNHTKEILASMDFVVITFQGMSLKHQMRSDQNSLQFQLILKVKRLILKYKWLITIGVGLNFEFVNLPTAEKAQVFQVHNRVLISMC